jgi:hypothetical protein
MLCNYPEMVVVVEKAIASFYAEKSNENVQGRNSHALFPKDKSKKVELFPG